MRVTNEALADNRSDLRKQFDAEYEEHMKKKRKEYDKDREKYAASPEDLMIIDASEVYDEGEAKEEMFEFWLQNFVLPDVERSKESAQWRKNGTETTREKGKANTEKIIQKASSFDPKKIKTASALAEILVGEFKTQRKSPSKKSGLSGCIKLDTSYSPKGFKFTSIYNALKKNGWK